MKPVPLASRPPLAGGNHRRVREGLRFTQPASEVPSLPAALFGTVLSSASGSYRRLALTSKSEAA